jgi:hypothetical protein
MLVRATIMKAEPAEDVEGGVRPAVERPCGLLQVARDEEAPGGLGGDLHEHDACRSE